MKMRKILSWLLVISMLLTGMLLVSCNDDDDDDDDDDDIPEHDLSPTFDGDIKKYKGSFNVLTGPDGTATSSFNIVDLVADNNLGDAAIIKVVRERNELIETNFGIKIKRTKLGADYDETYTNAQAAVKSESTTYDAFILPITKQIDLACQGGMLNLYQATYMDIEAPWWDGGVAEGMLLAGGAYFAMGDLQTVDKDATYCTLFNKELLDQYNKGVSAESLYAKVKEGIGTSGGFTMEYLNQLAKNHATADVNGANMWDPSYDGIGNYGLYTQSEMTRVILQSAGYTATKVDSSSVAGIKSNITQDFQAAVGQVKNVFGVYSEDSWFCNLDKYQSVSTTFWDTHARGSFKSNRATFYMTHVGTIDNLRDMKADFGVLPVGKLYDTQTEYGNTVQYYNCRTYSVPNRGAALNDKSSYILEAMAYYSSLDYADDQSLNYAYYYKVLRGKGTRDDASWEMLDIIFDNRKLDLVFAANIGGVSGGVGSASSSRDAVAFSVAAYGELDTHIIDKLKTLINENAS